MLKISLKYLKRIVHYMKGRVFDIYFVYCNAYYYHSRKLARYTPNGSRCDFIGSLRTRIINYFPKNNLS